MNEILKSRTMALNADGATPYFQMENNYIVPKSHTPMNILTWVKTHAERQGGLNALVIHSHSNLIASEGGIELGGKRFFEDSIYGKEVLIGTGITAADTALFEMLSTAEPGTSTRKGIIKEIYFTGCGVAQTTKHADGNLFCCAVAKAAGAYVYASTEEQWLIDPFGITWRQKNLVVINGTVIRYNPDGSNKPVS